MRTIACNRYALKNGLIVCACCPSCPAKPSGCALDSGKFIEPCLLAYRTYGRLNAEGSNAILFPTWYNGRSEDLKQLFGADKFVDTTKFFGVAIDALGDGVSSSPSISSISSIDVLVVFFVPLFIAPPEF
jgi:hypothetical protein